MRHRRFLVTLLPVMALALCPGLSVAQMFDLPQDHALWPPEIFRSAYKLIASEGEMRALDTLQGGRIPGAMLKKGRYILEVKTRDLLAGSERTALASLQVK